MQDNYSTGQTEFSAEEPLFESSTMPAAPVVEEQPVAKKTFFQTKAFKVGAGIAIVLLIVLVATLMLMNGGQQQQVASPSPTPSAAPTSVDPLQQRITVLSQQLLEADPANDSLPLPPVDLTITLEE